MTRPELTLKRGKIVNDFLHLEWTLSLIITYKYFKRADADFLAQVMCDDSMTFGLRMNILDKISPTYTDSQKLRKLNKIRNYFAHCHLHVSVQQDSESFAVAKSVHPKKFAEFVDFETFASDFDASYETVRLSLLELLYEFGGKFEPFEGQVEIRDE